MTMVSTHQNDGPSPKRRKPSGDSRENNIEENHATLKRAWEHYRNFIDCNGDNGDGDSDTGCCLDDGETGEGDVDELLELIEILSSTEITPFASDPSANSGDDDNADMACATRLHSVPSLLSILLSLSYLHLASHAISEAFVDPNQMNDKEEDDSKSSSPGYYFRQSLHYWPTNPAANSLLANYHRMNSLSTTDDICKLYVNASEWASRWRKLALNFLESSLDEEEEVERIDTKEWVELLVLNGALGVDYIGGDDEDDSSGSGEANQEDEYSSSEVEATASFMSAFLMSILSKHHDALPHLKKFRLSHRIHPNVWKAAQHHNLDIISTQSNHGEKICNGKSTIDESSQVIFPPRIHRGGNDGVLPIKLYQRLCTLFAPNSSYWKESDYQNRGYYSYFLNLGDTTNDSSPSVKDRPTNVIEDVIAMHLLPLAEQALRENTKSAPQRIVGAEWWVHTRPLGANLGHQVHFDTDESLLGREKRVTHPIISSVLYLTGAGRDCEDAFAGSTIVFDQSPESTCVASQAWVSHSRDNTFMSFPGNLLHGVLPCVGDASKVGDGHRLTFMVGWWTRNVTEGMGERNLYTPCGPLPPPDPEHSWVLQSQRGYCDRPKSKNENVRRWQQFDLLPLVSPAWEEFQSETKSETTTSGSTLMIPKGLDHRFFVWNAPHCFSDSLYAKEDCF